ncbi:hypothetical protein NS359_12395 [Curtobacterium oceanosedimentum]|uniref:Uncharacterized protein n=1 Tax=Curtobacterium oceanosedimentum TaxID=465820 RepID=A0A147DNP7_9MICO|nr:hypothetical protein NS359_12395 [Curtobacterium oceanosedimentum]
MLALREAMPALSANTCEKYPRNSRSAFVTAAERVAVCPSIADARLRAAVFSASASPYEYPVGSLPWTFAMSSPPDDSSILARQQRG